MKIFFFLQLIFETCDIKLDKTHCKLKWYSKEKYSKGQEILWFSLKWHDNVLNDAQKRYIGIVVNK